MNKSAGKPKPTGKLDLSGLSSFSSLLETAPPADAAGLREIPIDDIAPDPDQPRQTYDATKLSELADSIRVHGVIQPLVLRTTESGYQIIAGERRWRAAKQAGLVSVPAIIRDDLSARAQMVENLQREDLTPFEIYRVIAAEIDGGTLQKQLADAYGKSKSWVSEFASVAKMPIELQDALREGRAGDIYALSELNRLHKRAPAEVEKLASSGAPITRYLVNQLAESLARAVTTGAAGADPGKTSPPAGSKEAPKTTSTTPPASGVADNGEGLDIGGRGPAALPGTSSGPGSASTSSTSQDDGQSTKLLPNDLPIGIRVRYEGETYWVRYDRQRQEDDKTLVMLANETGLTLYAPLDALVLSAIYPHHNG